MEPAEYHWPFSVLFSFFVASKIEPLYPIVAQRIPIPDGAESLLEIGGGDGRLAIAMAESNPTLSRVIATDISSDMVRLARKNIQKRRLEERVTAEVQDAQQLTHADDSLDVIISLFSFHHWKDPVEALCEFWRCLKPGGGFAVIDGCDRPSFGAIRDACRPYTNSFGTPFALWIGRWDLRTVEEIRNIIQETKIDAISLEFEGPLAVISAMKPEA